jgi:hypothetical protein
MPANPTPSAPELATGDNAGVDFEPLFDAILQLVEQRVECDDLITYLENGSTNPLVPAGQAGEEEWRSTLVLQACVSVGGVTPSSVIALLERYTDAIRAFATMPKSQTALVRVLSR